jgi:RNA exonuclease 1
MHFVLNTFFQAPVSSEEKKRRLQERIAGPYPLCSFLLIGDPHLTAERAGKKDPAQYLLTVEQIIENDHPVPSNLADIFRKLDGWIETPQATTCCSVGGSNNPRD